MHYTVAHATDVGRTRSRNEDAAFLLQWTVTGLGAPEPLCLAAVADGMGGQANGDVAAALTVRTLGAEIGGGLGALPWQRPVQEADLVAILGDAVRTCAARVNHAIKSGYGPMGSTLTVALFWAGRLLVANVGDSRTYLVHQQLQQITTDHSLVAHLVAQGQLTHEQARVHPRRNEIYRMIGFERPAEADLFTLDLEVGDTVLLCSDGLYTMVTDQEIFAVMTGPGSLAERCRRLVDLANEQGGEDNVTVVAVQCLPEESDAPAAGHEGVREITGPLQEADSGELAPATGQLSDPEEG